MSDIRDKFTGAALGAAIGDALGAAIEFDSDVTLPTRRKVLGLNRAGCRPTDDTQMALVVMEALSQAPRGDENALMDRIARGFVEWSQAPRGGHRAPGNECLRGCAELRRRLFDPKTFTARWWEDAGVAPGARSGGGCGSVMRAYPFGLIGVSDGASEGARLAVMHSGMTHRHPIALAACAAMAAMVSEIIAVPPPANSDDAAVFEAVCDAVAVGIDVASSFDAGVAALLRSALDAGKVVQGTGRRLHDFGAYSPEAVFDAWRGWDARTAIAAGVYAFVARWDDPREALLLAANTPGDSDSIATITGALIGALHGAEGLPRSWRSQVEWSSYITGLAGDVHANLTADA